MKPDQGKIFVNNENINFSSIYKKYNCSLLTQNPFIIDDNMMVNITLKSKISEEDISRAIFFLKKFNMHKYVNSSYLTKNSIATIKKFSDGEKQRIAFIRSIFYNPSIIILDEPTSSLDKKNEQIIFKYLLSIKNNKIIIVTTHNEKNQKYFDKVLNTN